MSNPSGGSGRKPHAYGCKGLCDHMFKGIRKDVPKHIGGNEHYTLGAKRCMPCEIFLYPPVSNENIRCPCCGNRLRVRSRHPSTRKKIGVKRIE